MEHLFGEPMAFHTLGDVEAAGVMWLEARLDMRICEVSVFCGWANMHLTSRKHRQFYISRSSVLLEVCTLVSGVCVCARVCLLQGSTLKRKM